MVSESIRELDLMKIFDTEERIVSYGCNQEWYRTVRQQQSGCGPAVASNIVFYLLRLGKKYKHKEQFVRLMEGIWQYVTPGSMGIPKASILCRAMGKYMESQLLDFKGDWLDIPKNKERRPAVGAMVKFIETAVCIDAPVAFLNLCNGKEYLLEAWHWVTIIAIEYAEDYHQVGVSIMDNGVLKKIDLLLWYQSTRLGGGFVYFAKK